MAKNNPSGDGHRIMALELLAVRAGRVMSAYWESDNRKAI